jgi:predicted CoA-binding protein
MPSSSGPSARERFWDHKSFVVVGDSAKRKFPRLTYGALKKAGKTVYAVDPSSGDVDGDKAYPDFKYLPKPVEAAVLELPKEETAGWVKLAAEAGVKNVWIHQMTDTPEALAVAEQNEMSVCTGTCAVMYVIPGLSGHAPHRWIMRLLGKY